MRIVMMGLAALCLAACEKPADDKKADKVDPQKIAELCHKMAGHENACKCGVTEMLKTEPFDDVAKFIDLSSMASTQDRINAASTWPAGMMERLQKASSKAGEVCNGKYTD